MECTHWGVVELLVAAGMVAAFHVRKVPPAIPSIRRQLGAMRCPIRCGWSRPACAPS
jgi:hypothetical protein